MMQLPLSQEGEKIALAADYANDAKRTCMR